MRPLATLPVLALLLVAAAGVSPAVASAQLDEGARRAAEPARILASAGGGMGVRLVRNLDFQQDRFAPSYFDLTGGLVFPGQSGRLRHGASLSIGSNLSSDGSFHFGLDALQQWVVTPAYLLRIRLDDAPVPASLLHARVGVPLAVSPDFSPGLEVSGGFTYLFLAGLGVYAEVGVSAFIGGEDRAGNVTIHPILSAELGLTLELEVLP